MIGKSGTLVSPGSIDLDT